MKLPSCLRFFSLLLGLGLMASSASPAPDLPSGLLLPPLPPELATPPAPARATLLPGLPGGPAPVFVPSSHLTLPEKPSALLASINYRSKPRPATQSDSLPEDFPLDTLAALPSREAPDLTDLLPSPDQLPAPSSSPSDLPPSSSQTGNLPVIDNAALAALPASEKITATPSPGTAAETETDSDSSASTEVPGTDLAPTPQKAAKSPDLKGPGPVFRVPGNDAVVLARQLGYRFTPAQGSGRRDGIHTVASQVPNVLTSEVHGVRMMQMRPGPLWSTAWIENTFYMFCDASYNAVRLAPGWKIRGIQLQGPDWAWVACPRAGANTASFSIRIRSWKTPSAPAQGSVVTLQSLTLEGPPGALDWKTAFPNLNKPAAISARR